MTSKDSEKVNTVKQLLQTVKGDDPDAFLMGYIRYINSIQDKNAKLEVYNAVKAKFGIKFNEEEWKYMMQLNN